jgi:Tfp pilus assembly protein PilF
MKVTGKRETLSQQQEARIVELNAQLDVAASAIGEGVQYLRRVSAAAGLLAGIVPALESASLPAPLVVRLGEVCQGLGDDRTARRLFERALVIEPHNADALSNLGAVSFAAGDGMTARRYLQQALTADPSHVVARQNLAAVDAAMATTVLSV